jgi:hypothetical protein
VNFSEQPPSQQWAALKHRGETIAEVWFKPEGDPFALAFRIPSESFQSPDANGLLTIERLLKAVGLAKEEVESWRNEAAGHGGASGPDSDLKRPLAPPPPDLAHLKLYVSLKPPPRAVAAREGGATEIPEARWQHLEARWNAILALETSMDVLRMSMEAVRAELEASARKTLAADEKLHALNADVAQWNKAKSRVHYTVPKAREFIHRCTWATGTPERKRLAEVFKNHVDPRIPFPEMDQVAEQLEHLLKDWQSLSAQGVSVYQECKSVSAAVQGALRTLQSNAAANATKKRGETRARGKFF